MVKLRFPSSDAERQAIGYLAGRYSFKTFADGYTLVPEAALQSLAFRFPSKVEPPMNTSFRRFEILLPLRFNDGSEAPNELVADTLLELRSRFGACFLRNTSNSRRMDA